MRSDRDKYGLPPRLFLYTLDQISDLLQVPNVDPWIHYEGRTPGRRKRGTMTARNIAPPDCKPEWRIEEREFILWMKETGVVSLSR